MRKHVSTILKVAISIAGLLYAFSQVPIASLRAELASVDWGWIGLGFVMIWIGIGVRAYRWLTLVQGLRVDFSFWRLLYLYFVGAFFNTFLPTGFGGDVVRVMEASRHLPRRIAAGTVIVDRMSGLLMLFVMALFALPFRPDSFPQPLLWVTLTLSIGGLVGGFLLLEGRVVRRFGGWLPGPLSLTDEKRPLAKLLDTVQACGRRALLKALLVSTTFNLLLVGLWWVMSHALGLEVNYAYFLLVVPIMSIILLVPSIGGLGIRESLAPTLFAGAGLVGSEAVALALLVSVSMKIAGLIGGPLYALTAVREREQGDVVG